MRRYVLYVRHYLNGRQFRLLAEFPKILYKIYLNSISTLEGKDVIKKLIRKRMCNSCLKKKK